MDGPLAFAYHQLPPLILHPPRSNCDATFLAYNTRLIYRETRNIARHIDTHRKERRTDGRTHACQPESYAVTGERSPPPQQQPFFQEQFFNPPDLLPLFFFFLSRDPEWKSSINERKKTPCFDYHPTNEHKGVTPTVTESICNGVDYCKQAPGARPLPL